MTWISLVCLLALSGAVFGRSVSYGGYGGSTRVIQPPIQSGYGQELPPPEVRINSGYGSSVFIPPMTRTLPVSNYGGYGSSNTRVLEREVIIDTLPPSQADILCRGQLPQTVIPIDGNSKFVVCLDDGKGTEQSCPEGLLYSEQARRCEHVLGPREDFCISQPCLNGGQCLSGESTFQCQCAPGWDGMFCELDASFCQNNRPCGSDPRVRCQSFRPNAALQWICVSDDDLTYGPDGQHIHRSICQNSNGPHALDYTDKGFYMCNGERPFYESCARLTKWDNLNKACVWPEEGTGETRLFSKSGYGDTVIQPATRVLSSYGGVPETRRISSYGGDVILPAPMPETRTFSSYGGVPETKTFSSYGAAPITKSFSSYGGETKTLSSYGGDVILPAPMPETRTFSSYGSAPIITKSFSSYGGVPETKTISSYGGDVVLPAPMPETRTFSSYGSAPITKTFSSYGSSRLILPPTQFKSVKSYGGY